MMERYFVMTMIYGCQLLRCSSSLPNPQIAPGAFGGVQAAPNRIESGTSGDGLTPRNLGLEGAGRHIGIHRPARGYSQCLVFEFGIGSNGQDDRRQGRERRAAPRHSGERMGQYLARLDSALILP